MQTTSYSLGELLRRAKEGSLTIPQFQRDFVWRESQVALLVDSMSRSYPIGSLLLLAKNPDFQLNSRNIEAEIRQDLPVAGDPPQTIGSEDECYILDGQQRTTSIARVFLDAHPKKVYYFDLKKILEEHRREETQWIRPRQRGKSTPDRKDRGRLLRADIILEQEKADIYVSEYLEDSGDVPEFKQDRKKAREAAARIKGVFETIRNYKIPVVVLERDCGVESVCRVFETINSTGTRLTTFDLAVARFYPKPDLRKLWQDTLDEYSILQDFEVDGERVLQVLFLVTAAREGKQSPEPTRTNLLGLTAEQINQEWRKSSGALASTYKWAMAQGARPKMLPSHNMLVSLAAVRRLTESEGSAIRAGDQDLVRRWYFSKVLHAGALQASNYRIGRDFQELKDYATKNGQLFPSEVVLNQETILGLRRSDVRYRALQNILATTIRHDFFSGDIIDSESDLHDHHIFPKNADKRHGLLRRKLDGICNSVPVLARTNQRLGERYPPDYFQEMVDKALEGGTVEALRRTLKDCLIPGDPLDDGWAGQHSVDKFDKFCRERAGLIIHRVREVIGESLRDVTLGDEDLVEGGDI